MHLSHDSSMSPPRPILYLTTSEHVCVCACACVCVCVCVCGGYTGLLCLSMPNNIPVSYHRTCMPPKHTFSLSFSPSLTHTHTHTLTHARTRTHAHTHTRARAHTHTYAHMHAHTHKTHTQTHQHTQTHTHTGGAKTRKGGCSVLTSIALLVLSFPLPLTPYPALSPVWLCGR